MSYHLEIGESIEKGIKRIAHEQLDSAIDELTDDKLDPHDVVHQVRKRCKKLRGLLRLVRLSLADGVYDGENACYRDAARQLSYARDAQSLIETHDSLVSRYDDQLQSDVFASIRKKLVRHRVRVTEDEVGLQHRLDEFYEKMCEAKTRVDNWKIEGKGFDSVAPGLEKTYNRGRKAMGSAYEKLSVEKFHEWRKRSKYHRYHSRLLQMIWMPLMQDRRNEAKALTDYLGEDHDLAILRKTVVDDPEEYGNKRDIQAFVAFIDRRRSQVQTQAQPLGQRLFCEPAQALSNRLRGYWDAWQYEQSLDSY